MRENLNIPSDFLPVIDMHCHIFPDSIAEKAMINVGRFYDLPMYTKGTLSELYAVCGGFAKSDDSVKRRIVMQVIFSPAVEAAQTKHINDFIADICSRNTGIIGFGTLHKENTDYKEEIYRIKTLGLMGIKFHSDFQQFYIDDPAILPIYHEIAASHMPVIFHMGDKNLDYSAVSRLKNILAEVPELTVIAAHMGGYLHWNEAYRTLPVSRNLYFDISSTLEFICAEDLKMMLDKFGNEHFFFGSDFPMWNPNEEILKLHGMGLSKEVIRKIEYHNFVKFLEKYGK